MNTMTDRKARDLLRLIRHEGQPITEIYELEPIEDVDGNPLAVERRDLGGGTIGRVKLTSQQWEQLAHYAAQSLPEDRRRALVDAKPHYTWAEVARTFINNIPQGGTND